MDYARVHGTNFVCRFGFVALLAVSGCGGGTNNTNNDLGTTNNGNNDLSMTTNNGNNDLAGTNNMPADCASIAASNCSIMKQCTPELFILAYENDTICKDQQTKACQTAQTSGDNGVMDPGACAAAVSASCDAYFSRVQSPPAACQRKLGNVADQGKCSFDSQCGAGEYCYATTAGCPGACQMASGAMGSCTTDHDCDTDNGYRCVATFDMTNGSDGNPVCQQVTYGASATACFDGSNKQCANGFQCANKACSPVLAAGAPCDGAAASLCDLRRGHTCEVDSNNNHVCTPPHVVQAGAQCGPVMSFTQVCSAYAICGGGAPTTCQLRVTAGMPCTTVPDNCYPGLQCKAGTCQPPDPVTCN
jgi:hypothetical protein